MLFEPADGTRGADVHDAVNALGLHHVLSVHVDVIRNTTQTHRMLVVLI
jgi:hypothetical protein